MFTYHVQSWDNEILDTVLRSNVSTIKVMDPDPEPIKRLLERNSDLTVWVRPYLGFDEQQSEWIETSDRKFREDGGQRVVERISKEFAAIQRLLVPGRFVAEAINEPPVRFMWDDSPKYSAFTARFARYASSEGIVPAGFSFAPGNLPGLGWVGAGNPAHRGPYPTFVDSLAAQWRWFNEGLDGLNESKVNGKKGYIAGHSYGRDDLRVEPSRSYGVLRYRSDNLALQSLGYFMQFGLTEFGLDQGFMGAPAPAELRGYKSIPISPEQYAEQMKEIFQEMLLDKGILLAVTLFSLGHDWKTYSTVNENAVIQVMAEANNRHREESPADLPEGAWKMPLETEIGLTYPRVVSEGQTITFFGSARGIDGQGVITAKIGLPVPTEGGDELGVGPVTTGIPIAPDGSFSFQMTVPIVRRTVPDAFVELTTFEIDNPDSTRSDDDIIDGKQFVYPLYIKDVETVVATPVPVITPVTPDVPVPATSTLSPEYDSIYAKAGDIHDAAVRAGDAFLPEVALDIHRYISFLKGETNLNPFANRKK